ncbi:uncharacterized protein LOC144664826 [Oculina patagonica]
MGDKIVLDWEGLKNHVTAIHLDAQLTEAFQTGPSGLTVVSHVVKELNIVTDHAPIHRLLTMEHHAEDLLKKHRNVPQKCAQHQLTEGIQTGPPGLTVVSHVVMELNSVTDHAPIHRLQTMEHHAEELEKKHGYVPLNCVYSYL